MDVFDWWFIFLSFSNIVTYRIPEKPILHTAKKWILCSFFDSSLKIVVKVNVNKLNIARYFKFPFSWIHSGLRNVQLLITIHDLQNTVSMLTVSEWKSFVCGIEAGEKHSAWGWYISTKTIMSVNQERLNNLHGQPKAALWTWYRPTSSWCSQVLCAAVVKVNRWASCLGGGFATVLTVLR